MSNTKHTTTEDVTMKETILGFGAMRLPQTNQNDPKSVKIEETTQMIDYYMEQGFNYFDTSYAYHDETSENILKKNTNRKIPTKIIQNRRQNTNMATHQKRRQRKIHRHNA